MPSDDFFDFMLFNELISPAKWFKWGRRGKASKGLTKEQALTVFYKKKGLDVIMVEILDKLPEGRRVYTDPQNCWYILYQNNDGFQGLRSSQVMAVCKQTGAIKYDGSLRDEG